MNLTFLIVMLLPGLLYLGWIGALYLGFRRMLYRKKDRVTPGDTTFISIIIPARNEEKHIKDLLEDLYLQSLEKSRFEVLVVDDHSDDRTAGITADFIAAYPEFNLWLMQAGEHPDNPKKMAIATAVARAQGNLLVTVDADCRVKPEWLTTLCSAFSDPAVMLVAGPVWMIPGPSVFGKMQALEFLSLIGSGIAMAGWNQPILANGANLACRRTLYDVSAIPDKLRKMASGDDIQLLVATKNTAPEAIRFLMDTESVVSSYPQDSLQDFFQQRVRWASKARTGYDPANTLTALWVFLYNLLLIVLFPAGLIWTECLVAGGLLFGVKVVADFIFLDRVTRWAGQRKLLRVYLPLQLLYPWYIVITALGALLGTYRWKSREFRRQ